MGVGCAPATPALPPPGVVGSNVFESSRESSDFDGSADCEKGVIGEVKLAEVLAAPVELPGNDVASCGGAWFALLTGVGGLCRADMAMYVSTHFAGKSKLAAVDLVWSRNRCLVAECSTAC